MAYFLQTLQKHIIHAHTHTDIGTLCNIYIYICMYICIHIYIYMCIYIFAYIYVYCLMLPWFNYIGVVDKALQ